MNQVDQLIVALREGNVPSGEEIRFLCEKVNEILIKEDNVVYLDPPISVCGDLHGQFYDLLELFAVGGDCLEMNYCFMGDYVDRGYHSVETMTLLLALKVRHPSRITLLRGNHESRSLTQVYSFYDECHLKFSLFPNEIYHCFMSTFDLLPLCAVIGQTLFAVHGGLSPKQNHIHAINKEIGDRKKEIPFDTLVSDLLWSDPNEDEASGQDWEISSRGAGFVFGSNAVTKFHHVNYTECILRSHQLVFEGYRYAFDRTLCTVWSAPNYHYTSGNKASILEIDEYMRRQFILFDASPDSLEKVPKTHQMNYFL